MDIHLPIESIAYRNVYNTYLQTGFNGLLQLHPYTLMYALMYIGYSPRRIESHSVIGRVELLTLHINNNYDV